MNCPASAKLLACEQWHRLLLCLRNVQYLKFAFIYSRRFCAPPKTVMPARQPTPRTSPTKSTPLLAPLPPPAPLSHRAPSHHYHGHHCRLCHQFFHHCHQYCHHFCHHHILVVRVRGVPLHEAFSHRANPTAIHK